MILCWDRDKYKEKSSRLEYRGLPKYITRSPKNGLKRSRINITIVRGWKRDVWVEVLQIHFTSEFGPLRKLSVKFNLCILLPPATNMFHNSEKKEYCCKILNPRTSIMLHKKINDQWIQTLTERLRIMFWDTLVSITWALWKSKWLKWRWQGISVG